MYQATLMTTCRVRAHNEVCTPSNPSPDGDRATWPYEVTFDGGARRVGDHRVAGAGATLWQHSATGLPRCIAQAIVALPGCDNAQLAEAVGCRIALQTLTQLVPGRRAARIVGDNLAVIRYCAGNARMRRPYLQAQLELGLRNALQQGWQLTWQAVRRRLNRAADALATEGLRWAAQLRQLGDLNMQVRVSWL